MLTLVVTVFVAVGFAFFATQNSGPVSLNFGQYTFPDLPIYLVAIIPLLTGILLSWLFHITKDLSSSLTINEQRDKIKKLKGEAVDLTKKVHELELENTKLETETGKGEFDEDEL